MSIFSSTRRDARLVFARRFGASNLAARLLTASLFAALAVFAPPLDAVRAQQGGWVLLGQREVSDRAERDVVPAPGGALYAQLRVCAVRGPIRMRDLDIVFRNGARQDASVPRRIGAGACTPVIALRGRGPRSVKRVVLRYDAVRDNGPQPIAQVFAR